MDKRLLDDLVELRALHEDLDSRSAQFDLSIPEGIDRFAAEGEALIKKDYLFGDKYAKSLLELFRMIGEEFSNGLSRGVSVPEIIQTKGIALNINTGAIVFKIVVEDGRDVVVGGELILIDLDSVYRVKISEDKIIVEPVDEFVQGCRTTIDIDNVGSYQQTVVKFFKKEYAKAHTSSLS